MQPITRKEQRILDRFNALVAEGKPINEARWQATENGMLMDVSRLQEIDGWKAARKAGETQEQADARVRQKPETIDLTPTWGEAGLLFYRLAVSKEVKALQAAKSEFARAFAAAQALQAISKTLTDEQSAIVAKTIEVEISKFGY